MMMSTLKRLATRPGALLRYGLYMALLLSPAAGAAQLSLIQTAESSGALEGSVVEGGRWLKVRHLRQQVVVIRHRGGVWLLDAGIGRATANAFAQNSLLNRLLFGFRNAHPAADQLQAAGFPLATLQGILLTHLHWDHAGGLPDFPGVPVWVQAAELAAANHGAAPSYLGEHRNASIVWHTYQFPQQAHVSQQTDQVPQQAYAGFERSLDVMGDGRLILVDLPGHTAGHSGLFVNADNGKRYFFIGDTTWTQQGVAKQKSRPALTQWLTHVDHDRETNAATIAKIAALKRRDPALIVLPAHDERMAEVLPAFPQFTGE